MNYRKKEVVIQAVKWTGDNLEEVLFLDAPEVRRMFTTKVKGETKLRIQTLMGVSFVAVGDFVIKGTMGELYMYDAETFMENYETI